MEYEINLINDVFTSLSSIPDDTAFLHTCRLQVDPFIYASLDRLYGKVFQEYWDSTLIPLESNKAIVFVERRCHPNLKFCLQNAAYFAPGYAIHIFCSEANLDFIRTLCGKQISNIHIHTIFKTIGSYEDGKREYNQLLKEYNFWNILKEEHILTMETDTYLLRHIPDSIYQYEYVASKWPWAPLEPGGGGLSYRKLSVMKEICSKHGPTDSSTPQDCYVSEKIRILGYSNPSMSESRNYFTESDFSTGSIGTHQWWTFAARRSKHDLYTMIVFYLTLHL